MALSNFELLKCAIYSELFQISTNEDDIIAELQVSGATVLVNALRIQQVRRELLPVGLFSIYEALIQNEFHFDNPFAQMLLLLNEEHGALATRFTAYWKAINVLKHGKGRSHAYLLEHADELEFRVKENSDEFFCEGDISEVWSLIDVDRAFVESCLEIVNLTYEIVSTKHHNP